jgi:hypothetical protein
MTPGHLRRVIFSVWWMDMLPYGVRHACCIRWECLPLCAPASKARPVPFLCRLRGYRRIDLASLLV